MEGIDQRKKNFNYSVIIASILDLIFFGVKRFGFDKMPIDSFAAFSGTMAGGIASVIVDIIGAIILVWLIRQFGLWINIAWIIIVLILTLNDTTRQYFGSDISNLIGGFLIKVIIVAGLIKIFESGLNSSSH